MSKLVYNEKRDGPLAELPTHSESALSPNSNQWLEKDDVVGDSPLTSHPNTAILRSLLKPLPAIALLVYDQELRCVNAEGALLGEMVALANRGGLTMYEVLPTLADHSAQWSQYEPFFRSALLGQDLSFNIRGAERQFLVNVVPVRDDSGAIHGGMIVLQDVTEQYQMETALRTSEERYRLLVENYLDAVILASLDGQISMANEESCALFGYTATQLCAMNIMALLDQTDERVAAVRSAVSEGHPYRDDLHCIRADGHSFPVEFSCKVYYTAEDVPSHLIVIRDLTEVKQAERQTIELRLQKERVRLLTEFIRDVSHDFRTPLAIIQNSAYLMTRVGDSERQKSYQDKIVKQVNRLESILTDMMTMLRLDAKESISAFPVQVNLLLRDSVEQLAHPIKEKHLQVHYQFADGLPAIFGDPNDLDRAFLSLLDNAVRFTPEAGTITLKTHLVSADSAAPSAILVEIRDTGIGLAASELPQIFNPFYRADKARSAQSGGVGLGLPIAQRVVELHHGRIEVESLEGQGSTFRVYLPLLRRDEQVAFR
jgi:PAS domain S-box-containing protein